MPRLKEDQLQKIYEERKQQITSSAVKIFAQRGLPGTKISMITAEAGVSHGLFYHYFKTKEELFTSLVREAIGDPEELIASYLTILSGVMVLGKGYVTPQADWLLRFVEKK